MRSELPIALSYGGGVQSVAICVLIAEGNLPVPDFAAIADTSREVKSTWRYFEDHLQPFLRARGIPLQIHVIPHEPPYVGQDLYSQNGDLLVPAYTEEGRLPTYCSGMWKRDAFERWLRRQGVREAICWIGYSIDEIHRVGKKDHRNWLHNQYPLIDLFLNRALCMRLIEAAGLPIPKKSRCWGCPHQTDEEWAEVRDDPEQWARAVALDEHIRANDPEPSRGGKLYLYSGRVPLALADFSVSAGAA